MAEYSANAVQTITPAASAIFTESPVPCNRGLIFHRDETGAFRLASPAVIGSWASDWGCCCNQMPESYYLVSFHGNIAIPTGGTVGAISLALSIDGAVDPSSTMIVTPAAVEQYFNVGAGIIVAVPSICRCASVSVVNTSNQDILLQNANIIIEYQGIR